jgi:hypothetical protein
VKSLRRSEHGNSCLISRQTTRANWQKSIECSMLSSRPQKMQSQAAGICRLHSCKPRTACSIGRTSTFFGNESCLDGYNCRCNNSAVNACT